MFYFCYTDVLLYSLTYAKINFMFCLYSGSSNITVVLQQMNNITNEIVQLRNKFQVCMFSLCVHTYVHAVYSRICRPYPLGH